jgi:hypothetical protein
MACPKHEPLKGHDNGRGEQKPTQMSMHLLRLKDLNLHFNISKHFVMKKPKKPNKNCIWFAMIVFAILCSSNIPCVGC